MYIHAGKGGREPASRGALSDYEEDPGWDEAEERHPQSALWQLDYARLSEQELQNPMGLFYWGD